MIKIKSKEYLYLSKFKIQWEEIENMVQLPKFMDIFPIINFYQTIFTKSQKTKQFENL